MKEIRYYNDNFEVRNENNSRHISGYAVVFDSESKLIDNEFYEIVDKRAFDGVIEKSDVYCYLDHNRNKGVLARCNKGVGSLKLSVDNRGLKYEFEAPNTELGNTLIEHIKRGEISTSSFAFTIAENVYEKRSDGTILRTITKFDRLFDVSPVFCPAYDATTVDLRSYNQFIEDLKKEEEKRSEEEEKEKEEEVKETETPNENESEKEPEKEEKSEDKEEEKETSEETENEDKTEDKEEKNCEEKDERSFESPNLYNKENIRNHNIMSKKFSLVNAINAVVNNRAFDDVTANVIKEGRDIANRSGISTNGQIVLPVENRADGDAPVKPVNGIMATEPTIGQEIVPTDLWNIEGALRDRLVLSQAGAQFITASSNIEIPVYDGNNVFWESEIGEAKDGSGKFSKVTLSPKRLTAFVDISKMLLNQTSGSVENMLREDLINAVAEKLQKTILGNGKGSDVEPKGIFNDVLADTAAFTYNDAVDMEAALENANVYGDFSYIVNPNSKAALRVLPVDKGSGKFVYENNEVLGINAYSTNSVVNKGMVLGDFRQMVIANFGAVDLTVDTISRASFGQIRLVVNFYVDYAVKRPQAFVKRILK